MNTLDLAIRVPLDFSNDRLMQTIAQAVNAAVETNFYWYLGEWDSNRDPKCCPHCAGLRYVPGAITANWHCDVAPIILALGETSCEAAAAMHTGHKRADYVRSMLSARPLLDAIWSPQGMDAVAQSRRLYKIALEATETPNYWHVVSYDEGERHDAVEELSR